MGTMEGAPQPSGNRNGAAVASGSSNSGSASPQGQAGASAGNASGQNASAGNASAAASVNAMPKWKGRRVKRFKLVDELGEGAMGRVFLAEDTVLKRHVALKILPSKHRDGRPNHRTERLIREARSCASLDHPAIVSIFEIDEAGGIHYIAMELVEGGNLEKLVQMSGPMETERACALVAEAAEALAHAHQRGVIHRDIKPANLLLTRAGRCKVADFGLAAWDDADDADQRMRCVGTPYFIAPEVASGKGATAASDIYSLSCTLWFLLSGRQPFAGTSAREVMKQHINTPLPDLRRWRPDVSSRLTAAIEQACSKDPSQRFDSAERFAKVLRTFTIPTAGGSGSGSYVPPPLEPVSAGGSGGHGGASGGAVSGALPPISAAQLEAIMQAAAPAVAAAQANNPLPGRPAVHPALLWGGGGLIAAAVLIAIGVWLSKPGNETLAVDTPVHSTAGAAVAPAPPAPAALNVPDAEAPPQVVAAGGENGLINGSIDGAEVANGKVDGWYIAERCQPQVFTRAGEVDAKNKYMQLISIDASTTVHVDQNIELDPGWKSVVVSAKMRVSDDFKAGTKGSSGVTFSFQDANRKQTGGHQPALVLKGPTEGWVEREVSAKVPSGAKRLYLQCVVAYTKGTIDFDDVKVRGLK
jgi:tRNA A-37 threonylcarbamoyl transferase component Bud32